jgi:UDP-N-acetylglucosamine 1-carboxyvinyltransferase
MINTSYIAIEQSSALNGSIELIGAKNAVLVIISSLLLTRGKSRLTNVPASDDVLQMIKLMQTLGAEVFFYPHEHLLEIDTTGVNKWQVSADIMKKMRASILAMGPLLARFGKADVALPGGCSIGERPIDYHLKNFRKMGVSFDECGEYVSARAQLLHATRIVLEYPSVGATENILMAATLIPGTTMLINAALEPEVMDLITVVRKMGAKISVEAPASIIIEGVSSLQPIEHAIIPDRLEAGALLLAASITGGCVSLPQAHAYSMDVFLMKLEEMGHEILIGPQGVGVTLKATKHPKAVSFKTAPYPGFPTDLQAPTMAALSLAEGTSIVEETVFENRLLHVRELQKMGAHIKVEHNKAIIQGVDKLYGTSVIATDIRASCALVLAGLAAEGSTIMTGIHHWKRGYEGLENKLKRMGATVKFNHDALDVGYYTPTQNVDEFIIKGK